MNPSEIKLESLNLTFEFERLSRSIDNLEDINKIKDVAKYFLKLYYLQQETISKIGKV